MRVLGDTTLGDATLVPSSSSKHTVLPDETPVAEERTSQEAAEEDAEEEEGEADFEDALSAPRKSEAADGAGGADLEWFDPDLSGFSAAGQSIKSNNAGDS